MKRGLIITACVLVCLIPTLILVLSVIRTEAPKIELEGVELEPAYTEWITIGSNQEEIVTTQNEEQMEEDFAKATPIELTSLSMLETLTFEMTPKKNSIVIYSLTDTDGPYGPYTLDNLQDVTLDVGKYQVILLLTYELSSTEECFTAYSFEVTIHE